jgi:hypothetical protein
MLDFTFRSSSHVDLESDAWIGEAANKARASRASRCAVPFAQSLADEAAYVAEQARQDLSHGFFVTAAYGYEEAARLAANAAMASALTQL